MSGGRHRELHQFVRERAGDAYRAAFRYDETGWGALHVRDDLRTEALEEEIPEIHEKLLRRRALLTEEEYPHLGGAEATVEIHGNGVLLHFPKNGGGGTVVTLDRDVARRLTSFVVECQSILEAPSRDRKYRARAMD